MCWKAVHHCKQTPGSRFHNGPGIDMGTYKMSSFSKGQQE